MIAILILVILNDYALILGSSSPIPFFLPTFNMLSPTFKVARVSRLLRLLRVIKIIRYYEPLEIILAVIRRQSRILWTVFSLAIFYIFITALIMFNAEEDINPETGQYLFTTFFDAFY